MPGFHKRPQGVSIRDPPPRNSLNVPHGYLRVFIFSKSNFYAIYNGENHFQIRGLAAELHVFELLRKLALNVEDNRVGVKNHVFDHETRKSGLFPCYRLKINDFLSSYNQNLKIDIFTPLQQIPCYCKSRLGTLRLILWWRVTYGINPKGMHISFEGSA